MIFPYLLYLFIFEIYLLTHCATFNINDSGETIMVCDLLTISHSPGYPLHTLWGRVNCLLPLGQPMFRVTFASLLTASLSVVVLYLVLKMMFKGIFEPAVSPATPPSPAAEPAIETALPSAWLWEMPALFGALVFAFSYQHWFQAGGAKGGVYTLNTLFFTLILYFLFKMRESGWFLKSFFVIAFIFGLGLAHHLHDIAAMFPGYLWMLLNNQKRVPLDDLYRWVVHPAFPITLAVFFGLTFILRWGMTSSPSDGFISAMSVVIALLFLAVTFIFVSIAVRFMGWFFLLFTAMGVVVLAVILLTFFNFLTPPLYLFALATGVVVLAILSRIFGMVNLLRALTFGFLPVTVYIFLAIRAVQNPLVNWWNPDNWLRFAQTILRKGYQDIGDKDFWASYTRNIKRFWFHAQDQYGPIFTVLVILLLLWGVYWLLRRQKTTPPGIALMAGGILMGVWMYCKPLEGYQWTLDNFFATVFLMMAFFAAAGMAGILEWAAKQFPYRQTGLIASAFCMSLASMPLILNYHADDQSRYISSYDEGMNMLKTVNRKGVILCNGDIDILPLWYLQFVEGKRPEVVSFTMQLIPYDWYRDPLFKRWPFLQVPMRKDVYGRDDIRPEVVVQDMIDQHAKDRSFYFTNIFTAPWMREKNPAMPEGFLWRMTNTLDLGYQVTSDRINQLWDTYRLRDMEAPERGYWDEYTDVMKDSYGIGFDFTGYYAYMNKMPDLALWSFNNALKFRQPQTLGRIYMMLGETYLMVNDYSAAVNSYQESLKRDPRNPGVAYILARMGDCFRMMNDYSNADSAYHQSLQINPQQKEALDGLQQLNNGKREIPNGALGITPR
jgi:hypothetical protein